MADIDLSMEAMGLIREAEKRLRARIRDAVDEGDRVIFITEKGHLGQALGKQAKNLQMMRDLLKKDVKFVEWDDDKQIFVRNLFKPFDIASIRIEDYDPEAEAPMTLGDVATISNAASSASEGDAPVPQEEGEGETSVAETEAEPRPVPEASGGSRKVLRAIVEVEPKDKGKAIGKGGRNIAVIRKIARRHHGIEEVQVV